MKNRSKFRDEEEAYPAAGVNGGPNRPVSQVNELADIVNVSIGAVGKHGAAAGEPEPVALEPNPVLNRFLDGELLMGYIRVPGQIPAERPLEGVLVAVRRRHPAFQELVFLRAVSLSVY